MNKALLAALLLAAAPALALAQTGGSNPTYPAQGPTPSLPNLNNPQAEANQASQAPNARTDTNRGDAGSIPTPVLNNRPNSPTPQR